MSVLTLAEVSTILLRVSPSHYVEDALGSAVTPDIPFNKTIVNERCE